MIGNRVLMTTMQTPPSPAACRYWRFRTVLPGSNAGIAISELKLFYDGAAQSLVGKTLTNLGSAFFSPYLIGKMADGVTDPPNAVSIAYVSSGAMDVMVDLGADKLVTAFLFAPQGNSATIPTNTFTNLKLYRSQDAVNWALTADYTGISTGYPAWSPGTYRSFSTGL